MTHPGQILDPDARVGISWRISSYSSDSGGRQRGASDAKIT